MKTCTKCKKEKPLKEFYKTKTTKDGYTYNCIQCYQLYREEHREKQKLYMKKLREQNEDEIKKRKREDYHNLKTSTRLFRQSKARSKRKNIEFTLQESDIFVPEICPLINLPLVNGTKDYYEQTASIDRIDPNKGYTPDNIWVISKRANTMKSNASKEELITFALNIIKYFGNDDIVRAIWKHIEFGDKEPQS